RCRADQKIDSAATPWIKPAGYGLILSALCVAAWTLWPRFPQWDSDKLSIAIIDVGSGESIFVEFPNHETLLVDGGGFRTGSFDVGRLVVAPFLWNRGIGKIDYMAVTHSDQDHIAGLESLLKVFKVGYFLYHETAVKDPRIERLRQNAMAEQAVPLNLEIGRPMRVGEAAITLLHPGADFARREREKGRNRIGNSLSLAFRLDYREFSMLFAADIGEKEERYLIENRAALRADFLKAPHHGSKFSSSPAFIRAVQPKAAFFSSGYLNPFRHPDPDVVERYRQSGARVWRTDRHGALLITTDGYAHHVRGHEDL
ncbi:MAG: ComEC/Rec2 family competence protein, partial [Nitrospinales bacterium]